MKRCYDTKSFSYSNYGAKGVDACGRWHVFANFLADLGERPPGTTLGRYMDTGNYEPGNCQWMTGAEQGEQRRNKRAMLKQVALTERSNALPIAA
jgi:hypothetical protein